MAAPGQPRAPVATGGFLMLLSAFYSYNFIYSRFPPTARSGPSSPSRARVSSSSSGCFLGRKGIRDRYREEPFPRRPFRASFRYAHLIGIGAAVTRRPLPHHRAYDSVSGEPVAGFVGFPDPVRPADGIRSNVRVTCNQDTDTSIVVS